MNPASLEKLALDGKVAIITGGTQGLGETIAHLFADRGAAGIVICGRTAKNGEKVKAALEKKGVKAVYVEADLGKVDDARKVVEAADKAFGKVDALVNVAAITDRGTIWDTSPELFDRMFAINVRAPFFLTQEAAKIMRRNKSPGTIVNIISMSGHGGQSFITAYCASKGALITLTKNVANAYASKRIRCNGILTGWMDTPGENAIQQNFHGLDKDWLAKAEKAQPMGQLVKPDQVAGLAAYLLSPESGVMTGALVDYDQRVSGAYPE